MPTGLAGTLAAVLGTYASLREQAVDVLRALEDAGDSYVTVLAERTGFSVDEVRRCLYIVVEGCLAGTCHRALPPGRTWKLLQGDDSGIAQFRVTLRVVHG